ncbi:PrsW family intramembrane metalloprotease [Microlunatus soli]|uniref:PrsW family intramembrane metalloprotease n=1 Tax=Microlunatus soli TaxID=630515 RepID=UPI0012F71070|nr:PrsW family intramembrane metalloprotease [Microlunatus soli]
MPALTPKSVIEGRYRNRPTGGLIAGTIICGVCLLVVLAYDLLGAGPIHTVVGILLAVPSGLMVVGLLLLIDRLEPEPPTKMLFAFLWGAGVACLFALVINTAGIALIFTPQFGPKGGMMVGASIGAPIVEETLKGLVLLIFLWRSRDEIDGPTDGIIYAGMVGIGFAVVEDVNYYLQAMSTSGAALAFTFVLRGLLSPLCHPIFTSMTGLGITYAANHRGGRGVLAVLAGWVGAMLLHATWNFSSSFGFGGLAVAYGILLVVIVILIVLLVRDRRRVVGLIRRYLPAYHATGSVTPADVAMLSTLRERSQARRWAAGRFGKIGKRAMADYQLAATELALLHSHAESRTVDPRRYAFRQDTLVRLMVDAHNVFAPRRG